MSATTPTQPIVPATVPIAIIGTDAVLAAAPATPVQFAHACLRAGFANVIPVSWGDELIAAAVLRRLAQFGNGPAIQCSCPIVAHRLLSASGDLRPVLLPLVPPPVAVARYVRSLMRPSRTRITYIGACPGAVDDSIDIRMSPEAMIAMLAERDIAIGDQPEVFESIIPPDRRRFRSQPGGVPTAEALWSEFGARTLVELDAEDFVTDLAQHLLTGKNVLIDASTRLGCACSGATSGAHNPRAHVIALEPPRATSPVVEERTPIDLDLVVPAVSRTPVDVVAVSAATPSTHAVTPAGGIEALVANRPQAARPSGPSPEVRLPRLSAPVVPRSVLSAFPQARDLEGKALPRAYVARRRSSPRGGSLALPHDEFVPIDVREQEPDSPPTPLAGGDPVRSPSAPVAEQPPPTIAAPPTVAPGLPAARPIVPESVAAVDAAPSPSGVDPAAPVPSAVAAEPVLPEPVVSVEAEAASTPRAPSTATPAPPVAHTVHTVSDPVFAARTPPRSARPVNPSPTPSPQPAKPAPSFSRGQVALIVIAVAAIAICATTVVAVIVTRSVTAASTSTEPAR